MIKNYHSIFSVLFTAIALLFFQSLRAQVAVDAVSTTTATTSPITWTHTTSGSNRLLIVSVTTDAATVSSVTYNGVALTKIDAQATAFSENAELWRLVGPPIGTYSIVVTLSGDDEAACGGISFNNVHQTTTFGTAVKATASSATPSVTATTVTTNEMVVDVIASRSATLTVGAGQTQKWNLAPSAGYIAGATSTEPGVTAGTVAMTWTPSVSGYWAMVAVPIKASLSNCASGPTAGTASLSTSSIAYGATTTLSIAGESAACTYQWLKSTDGGTTYQAVSGATTDPYTTAGQTAGGKYKAVVTDASGCVSLTNVVTLTVATGPCGTCTRYISGATTETVLSGEIVCIKFGDTYTGTVTIDAGGTLCVDSATASSAGGTFSGRFKSTLWPYSTEEIGGGTVDNKGSISMATRAITMVTGIFKNSKTVTFDKLTMDVGTSGGTVLFTNRDGATLTCSNTTTGLDMKGTPVPTFNNNNGGTVSLSGGNFSMTTGTLTNDGTFTIAKNLSKTAGSITNSGTLTVTLGDFTTSSGTITNSGTLTTTNGNFTMSGGTGSNSASGVFNVNGAGKDFTLSSGGTAFTNSGDLNVADKIDMGIGGITFTNNLTVDANNWAMSTNSTLTNNSAGIITLVTSFNPTQVTQITNAGTITTGTIANFSQGPINNSGTINVGTDFTLTQGPLTNTGYIGIGQDGTLTQGGPHYNSGCIAVTRNFTHSQSTINGPAAVGTMGRFCVGGISTLSSATFGGTGSLDMCDAGHPATGWDTKTLSTDNGSWCSASAPSCGGCGTILPIELLSFDAYKKGDIVKLNWTTATEVNNNFFTVERTTDGNNYDFIGKLNGAGNSILPIYYNTIDEKPLGGLAYYRLKQTDYDGKFTYSKLIPVNTLTPDELKLVYFFSNHDKENLQYQLVSTENSYLSVEVTDVLGKVILSEKVGANQDHNQVFNLDATGLTKGVYLFKASDGTHSVMRKFLY